MNFNPVYVRLMARRANKYAWVKCPACQGKGGQIWKANSVWDWKDCPVCNGHGEVPPGVVEKKEANNAPNSGS